MALGRVHNGTKLLFSLACASACACATACSGSNGGAGNGAGASDAAGANDAAGSGGDAAGATGQDGGGAGSDASSLVDGGESPMDAQSQDSESPDSGSEPGDARAPDGEADEAGNPPADSGTKADSGPTNCTSSQYHVEAVDYFTGAPIAGATATVDSAGATLPCLTLATGVHPLLVTATGYAAYNGAIQVPGGAMSRTVSLFPMTPSLTAWLALVNTDRAANGAGPVQIDSGLMISGWNHVVDMGKQGYFAHFDTNGFAPTTRSVLLGSMMMGVENAAAGQKTYADAETSFMGEKSALPNQTASDCKNNYNLAGHYCDLITVSHNWIGFGLAKVPGSKYSEYYTQEFGDLYAYFDTTVIGPYPSVSSTATVTLVPAPGYTFGSEFTQTMPAPTPIPIATLNADPTCASMCPANDLWYPAANTQANVKAKAPIAYAPPLSTSEIVFLGLLTNETTFVGASVYATFWAGGTVKPNTYTDATSRTYLVQ
jgi:hypothetical protein